MSAFDNAWAFLKQEDPLGGALDAARNQPGPEPLELENLQNTSDEEWNLWGRPSAQWLRENIPEGGTGEDHDAWLEALISAMAREEPSEPDDRFSEGPDWRDSSQY